MKTIQKTLGYPKSLKLFLKCVKRTLVGLVSLTTSSSYYG